MHKILYYSHKNKKKYKYIAQYDEQKTILLL